MKKILFPTDFSHQANLALKVAVQWAERCKGSIYLVHIIDDNDLHELGLNDESNLIYHELISHYQSNAKQRVEALLQSMPENVHIEYLIEKGNVIPLLQEVIEKEQIDFLIIGHHGKGHEGNHFIGSTTEKIIRLVSCPVFIINRDLNLDAIKNIVFATNLEDGQIHSISKLKKIASLLQLPLQLLFINTPAHFMSDAEVGKQFEQFIQKYQLEKPVKHVYSDYTQEDGIINFVRSQQVDLLIMATHQRKGLSHFLLGSISENVTGRSPVPVVTLPFG